MVLPPLRARLFLMRSVYLSGAWLSLFLSVPHAHAALPLHLLYSFLPYINPSHRLARSRQEARLTRSVTAVSRREMPVVHGRKAGPAAPKSQYEPLAHTNQVCATRG